MIASLALLSGCALAPVDLHENWQSRFSPEQLKKLNAHTTSLNGLAHWQAKGRFAARNGEDAWSGHLLWQQDDVDFSIRLSGPLGQGGMLLQGNEQSATITLSRNRQFQADSANELVRAHAGLRLPLDELRYWLLGLPAPWIDYAINAIDKEGRIATLLQHGWRVEYSRYQIVSDMTLPSKIKLTHPEYQLRLVIGDWQARG